MHAPRLPQPIHLHASSTPADVRALLLDRLMNARLTYRSFAERVGLPNTSYASRLFTGRHNLASSQYFAAVCAVLNVTAEEQALIRMILERPVVTKHPRGRFGPLGGSRAIPRRSDHA